MLGLLDHKDQVGPTERTDVALVTLPKRRPLLLSSVDLRRQKIQSGRDGNMGTGREHKNEVGPTERTDVTLVTLPKRRSLALSSVHLRKDNI